MKDDNYIYYNNRRFRSFCIQRFIWIKFAWVCSIGSRWLGEIACKLPVIALLRYDRVFAENLFIQFFIYLRLS